MRYFGLITPGRVPHAMLAALRRARRAGLLTPAQARFEHHGEVDLLARVIAEQFGDIADFFTFGPRIDYGQALVGMASADHLLFCENALPAKAGEEHSAKGILTTKLFEYLAFGRPVLAHIGADTLAGDFIIRAGSQNFVGEREEAFVRYFASDAFLKPKDHRPNGFVQSLSRAGQADAYLELLDRVVDERRRSVPAEASVRSPKR